MVTYYIQDFPTLSRACLVYYLSGLKLSAFLLLKKIAFCTIYNPGDLNFPMSWCALTAFRFKFPPGYKNKVSLSQTRATLLNLKKYC